MSAFFRFFASITKTMAQALAPSSVILLILVLYTGFALPIDYMRGWISWIRWLNPIAYGFESCMINEFHDRQFDCSTVIPSGPDYQDVSISNQVCAEKGAQPGDLSMSGTAYISAAFSYEHADKWRNFGIILGMTIFLYALQLWMSEVVASERSKGEVLVFRRGKNFDAHVKGALADEETGEKLASDASREGSEETSAGFVGKQTSVFHWEDVCYSVKIKDETRTILDHVDGWIKPGTLTALMVSSTGG